MCDLNEWLILPLSLCLAVEWKSQLYWSRNIVVRVMFSIVCEALNTITMSFQCILCKYYHLQRDEAEKDVQRIKKVSTIYNSQDTEATQVPINR